MKLINSFITAVLLGLMLMLGCSSDDVSTPDPEPVPEGNPDKLEISISFPTANATNVPVTDLELTASLNKRLADPEDLTTWNLTLLQGNTVFYGTENYYATNKEVTLIPFNILRSNTQYTFRVEADGEMTETTFITERVNEGVLPPVGDRTYEFKIEEIYHPAILGAMFNSMLSNAPSVLMHVVELRNKGEQDGNHFGEMQIAGAIAGTDYVLGEGVVPPEDGEEVTSTTSISMAGELEGTWFGGGPSDLHITAIGIPIVIRDFYVTGIYQNDASKMESVTLTGLLDPSELDDALGEEVDLSGLCDDDMFSQYCDDSRRIRVAANVSTLNNPIPFTTFITKPVNAATDVSTDTDIQIYFSEEYNQERISFRLTDANGAVVAGQLTGGLKSASFKPDQPLAAKSDYRVEVVANSKSGDTDTRHIDFSTE